MKRATSTARWFLAIVAMALPAPVALGGTFRITKTWFDEGKTENAAYIRVSVGAIAEYRGPKDPEDNGWALQTFLNDSVGWDLDDWGQPRLVE